jgi:hypothetical protein
MGILASTICVLVGIFMVFQGFETGIVNRSQRAGTALTTIGVMLEVIGILTLLNGGWAWIKLIH